jgi:hypothetical protein
MALTAAVLASPLRASWSGARFEPWRVPIGDAVPAVYRWLAQHGEGAPVLDPVRQGMSEGAEAALAMYYSTYHWLPILVGHTGYYPPYYRAFLRPLLSQLPQPAALSLVVRCTGLRWVVIPETPWSRPAAWRSAPGVRLRKPFGTDLLFEVEHPATDGCPKRLLSRATTTLEGTPLGEPLALAGTLDVAGVGGDLTVGGESPVTISLHNASATTWPCTAVLPEGRVELEMRWMHTGDRFPQPPQPLLVPHDVTPGATVTFGAWLVHPGFAGTHRLRIVARRGDAPAGPALVWETDVRVTHPRPAQGQPAP